MRRPRRALDALALTALAIGGAPLLALAADDPLPSWNDTAPKKTIVAFVERVTRSGSPDFVPIPERIATFDNDGTLWAEQPMYVQAFFLIDRVKALAPQHPEWKTQEPFASLLKGDLATHTGMTTDEFRKTASEWIATAKHPRTGRLFTGMAYQPMKDDWKVVFPR